MKITISGRNMWLNGALALAIISLFAFRTAEKQSKSMQVKDFEAYMIDDVAFVSWMTSDENANDKVVLERSADGKKFHHVKTFRLNGTSSKYTFVDEKPNFGISYYRIKHSKHDDTDHIVPLINHNGPAEFEVVGNRKHIKVKAVHHHEETYLVSLMDEEGKHYFIEPVTFEKHRHITIDTKELDLESKEYIVKLQCSEWSVEQELSL